MKFNWKTTFWKKVVFQLNFIFEISFLKFWKCGRRCQSLIDWQTTKVCMSRLYWHGCCEIDWSVSDEWWCVCVCLIDRSCMIIWRNSDRSCSGWQVRRTRATNQASVSETRQATHSDHTQSKPQRHTDHTQSRPHREIQIGTRHRPRPHIEIDPERHRPHTERDRLGQEIDQDHT